MVLVEVVVAAVAVVAVVLVVVRVVGPPCGFLLQGQI